MTDSLSRHGDQVWIGIDPSKHKTGVAVFVNNELEYITTLDVWDVISVRKFREVLYEKNWIDVIHDVRISCEVSGQGKFSNFEVNRAAGMALGYITSVGLTCGPLKDRVKFWYPQQWRKAWFETASADKLGITKTFTWKDAARNSIAGLGFGTSQFTDDEVEAICLAILCRDFYKEQDDTKVQKIRNKRQKRLVSKAA